MDERQRPGARSKLDQTKQREICAILAVGGTRAMAARYVGCHPETIRRTALREPEFAAQLRKAEINSEIVLLRSIQTASQDVKQWRASAWALERLFPERYGRRSPRTITVEQVSELIRQLGTIIVSEIPVKVYRERILARLAELTVKPAIARVKKLHAK
jgi:hypothetical protein